MNLSLLISWTKDKDVIPMDYPGGPNAITRVIKCGQGKQKSQCQSDAMWGSWPATAGFENGKGSWGKEYRQPLEAGKGKETDSPLETPEGM